MPMKAIMKELGRSSGSIKTMAYALKLTTPVRPWSQREVNYLKKWYATKTAAQIAADLGRTKKAVGYKLGTLGITKESS